MNQSLRCSGLATAVLAALIFGSEARASCGASFCMVNTGLNIHGASTGSGLRLDLRYEFIDQDQPRHGSDKVGVGQIRQHHDEVRTVNRNWIASADYTFNDRWGASVTLPIVDRSHSHIHNHQGAALWETWNFTRIGDARVLGRRQWQSESAQAPHLDAYGVSFGMKLPTGERDLRNEQNALAERTLQPGTGTTDILLGAYFSRMLGWGSSWFVDVLLQQPLGSRDNFKPGTRVSFDAGYRQQITYQLSLMLQLNALHKDRDRGSDAEPADSGGKTVAVSPGISYMVNKNVQLYSFVQLPVYQYVNGVQLTADWAFVAGISTRF
jgi:hypothetical protein